MGCVTGMAKKGSSDCRIINGMIIISEACQECNLASEDVLDTLRAFDLLECCEKIKDWRNPDMIICKLHNLLMLAFLIILADGVNSFYGIANHVRVRRKEYTDYGLLGRDNIPSHDTFRRVFSLLDAQDIYTHTIMIFYDFLYSLEDYILARNTCRHMMLDGKEIRGSGRSPSSKKPFRNTNIFNVYYGDLSACVYSVAIGDKTNEIPVAQDFLRDKDLSKTVVTADALHCQRETADIISKQKGIYILPVKDNQPLLKEEIISRLEKNKDRLAKVGRDNRSFEIYNLPSGYAWDGFTGVKVFIRMISTAPSS